MASEEADEHRPVDPDVENDGSSSDSSDDGDSGDEEVATSVDWLATGREKRSTAGNRMKSMLAAEEPDDDLELLFAEADDDAGFTDVDDHGSDVQMDSSSDDEDAQEDADEEAGEKELLQQARERRQAARKRKAQEAIPAKFRKKVKIRTTSSSVGPSSSATATATASATPQPRPKKKSERTSWLPTAADMPTRASRRETTMMSKEQLHQQMIEREVKRLKQVAAMERKAKKMEALKKPPMTQAERLAEAAIIEKRNAKSLNRWEEAEKQREEERRKKLAALNNRQLKGPVITFWSGMGEWVDGKLKHVGKIVTIEEKPTKKRKRMSDGAEEPSESQDKDDTAKGQAPKDPALAASGSKEPTEETRSSRPIDDGPAKAEEPPSKPGDSGKPAGEKSKDVEGAARPHEALLSDKEGTKGSGAQPMEIDPPETESTTEKPEECNSATTTEPPNPKPENSGKQSVSAGATSEGAASSDQTAQDVQPNQQIADEVQRQEPVREGQNDQPLEPRRPGSEVEGLGPEVAGTPNGRPTLPPSEMVETAPQATRASQDVPPTTSYFTSGMFAPMPQSQTMQAPGLQAPSASFLAPPAGAPGALAAPVIGYGGHMGMQSNVLAPPHPSQRQSPLAMPRSAHNTPTPPPGTSPNPPVPRPAQAPSTSHLPQAAPLVKPQKPPKAPKAPKFTQAGFAPLGALKPLTHTNSYKKSGTMEDAPPPPPPSPPPNGKATRNCILLQNFNENAIKDKAVQTHILFGKEMSKLGKQAPAPRCVITNQPARYKDPRTGLPYYNAYAYKEIQKLQRGDYKWSRVVGAWVGHGSAAAAGVPARFLDPNAPAPEKKPVVKQEEGQVAGHQPGSSSQPSPLPGGAAPVPAIRSQSGPPGAQAAPRGPASAGVAAVSSVASPLPGTVAPTMSLAAPQPPTQPTGLAPVTASPASNTNATSSSTSIGPPMASPAAAGTLSSPAPNIPS